MNLNQLKSTYWIDQQTGEPIGPMYSWNDIREMQMNDAMREIRDGPVANNSQGSSRRSVPRTEE